MEARLYSFIIPVYNRPNEIKELLESFLSLKGGFNFEIVIIEDGSTTTCQSVLESFKSKLNISYYFKLNSGPGDSRNYGMQKAQGNYFIILDSDVLLPSNYLIDVDNYLKTAFVDCFGGPDAAHHSFSNLQKAINFSMTSFVTTGGIRGGNEHVNRFQPRSFNMGLSEKAFELSGGFGKIHPGEDPDLSLRLRKLGFKTALIKQAFVYHKRRISWHKFYKQIYKFGLVRPIISQWHPRSKSMVFWMPTVFTLGLFMAIILFILNFNWLLYVYLIYFVFAFVLALKTTKSTWIAVQSIVAIGVQFFAYGYGFLQSTVIIEFMRKDPRKAFPHLFFNS